MNGLLRARMQADIDSDFAVPPCTYLEVTDMPFPALAGIWMQGSIYSIAAGKQLS